MDGIDGSLARLGMDYVDIYMLHFFDVNTPVEETMRCAETISFARARRAISALSTMYTRRSAKIMQVTRAQRLA